MTQNFSRRSILKLGALAALSPWLAQAQAQSAASWPERPVTIIIPGSPGGTADGLTRVVAKRLQEQTGGNFIIDFKPGSGGIIGAQSALGRPGDGYTIFQGSTSTHGINFNVYKDLPYNADDFIPLVKMVSFPNVFVVNKDSPIQTFDDLVKALKTADKPLSYSSGGTGQTSHLSTEMFLSKIGTEALHIPYKGGAPSVIAVLSNEVDFTFNNYPLFLSHIQSGAVRPLAVSSANRMPLTPDIPTLAELGYGDLQVSAWLGFFVRADTPAELLPQISDSLVKALNDDEVRKTFEATGSVLEGQSGPEFISAVEREPAMWKEAIDAAGLEL